MTRIPALALLLMVAAAQADDSAADGPTPANGSEESAAPTNPALQPHKSGLPFLAEEALARGYELPQPFGLGLILTGIDNREIDVSDVRVGVDGSNQSVSEFATLGSSSTVFNSNLRFDTWLLPFMNVYAIVGYVHNESATDIHVELPRLGPIPGTVAYDTRVDTSLDGYVAGLGMTLAAGYKSYFMVADFNYSRADLGFDDNFTAKIGSIRAGWQRKVNGRSLQTWLGAGNWDTAATASGHAQLPDGRTLTFEADQHPHTEWMYEVGVNLMWNRHWQFFGDFASDFNGGHALILGPTWRF